MGALPSDWTVVKNLKVHTKSVVYSFAGTSYPPIPKGIVSYNGNLYGTTEAWGRQGAGVLFEVTPSGDVTILHKFKYGAGGSQPYAPVTVARGSLFGTTHKGGTCCGTIFEFRIAL